MKKNNVGTGAYGTVVQAYDKMKKKHVAIKKIFNVFDHDYEYQKRIFREIKILRYFRNVSDNIINLLDLIPPKSYKDFHNVYIVMDLMQSDLQELLNSNQEFDDSTVQYYMYQLLRGLLIIFFF